MCVLISSHGVEGSLFERRTWTRRRGEGRTDGNGGEDKSLGHTSVKTATEPTIL